MISSRDLYGTSLVTKQCPNFPMSLSANLQRKYFEENPTPMLFGSPGTMLELQISFVRFEPWHEELLKPPGYLIGDKTMFRMRRANHEQTTDIKTKWCLSLWNSLGGGKELLELSQKTILFNKYNLYTDSFPPPGEPNVLVSSKATNGSSPCVK